MPTLTPYSRARYRLRYAVRMGHLTPAERCEKCEAGGRIFGHFDDPEHEREVTWLCRACFEVLHPVVRVAPTRPAGIEAEVLRKLPHYDVLRRHLVDEGMSYQQIADKYKVGKSVTFRTVKDRAKRRNDWPLPIRAAQTERMAKAMARAKPTTFSGTLCDEIVAATRLYDLTISEVAAVCGVRAQYLQDMVRHESRISQKSYTKIAAGLVKLQMKHLDANYHERVELMRSWLQRVEREGRVHRSIRGICMTIGLKDGKTLRSFIAGRKRTISLARLERLEQARYIYG